MPGMLDESYIVEGDETPPTGEHPERVESPETPAEPVEGEQQAKSPITPIGRRQKAKEAQDKLIAEFTGLKESITKERDTYAERIARIEQENARLHGEIRGYLSRPQQAEQQREAPVEDPRKLLREANKLLDDKDFEGYQEKYAEYILARQPRQVQQQPQGYQGPAPINPVLQAVMSQYPDVISDPRGIPMSQAQDRVLEAQGLPDGPDRWNRAFTEARRVLGKQKPGARPQFSTENRAVLAGVPTNGTQPERQDGPGVRLTKGEKETARRFKMTDEQYAKHLSEMHPERVEK